MSKEIHVELSDEAASRWRRWMLNDVWHCKENESREQARLEKLQAEADKQRGVANEFAKARGIAEDLFRSVFGGDLPEAKCEGEWLFPDGHKEGC